MVIINNWGSSINYSIFSSGNGVLVDSGLLIDKNSAVLGLPDGFYNLVISNDGGTTLTGISTEPILEANSVVELKSMSFETTAPGK